MKKIVSMMFMVCMLVGLVNAQHAKNSPLGVGDVLPNFTFSAVKNHPAESLSMDQFRGKWLILDVWGLGCISCIKSFPKMDTLAQVFDKNVQVIMIGITNSSVDKRVKDVFKMQSAKHQLKITFAFDSLVKEKFAIDGVPFIVIVNPDGKIIQKTTKVEQSQIAALLKGDRPAFEPYLSLAELRALHAFENSDLPLLTTGVEAKGGIDTSFIFRSLLTRSGPEVGVERNVDFDKADDQDIIKRGRLELTHIGIQDLYLLAYFGVNWWNPRSDKRAELLYPSILWNATKLFDKKADLSYSLTVPKDRSSQSFLMKVMQSDLKNYFGVKARMELREVPIYLIEIGDKKKLTQFIVSGNMGKTKTIRNEQGLYVENCRIKDFCYSVTSKMKLDYPLFDNTGMDEKITVNFKADMADNDDIREKLIDYGFKLIEGTKKMQVIVIVNDDSQNEIASHE